MATAAPPPASSHHQAAQAGLVLAMAPMLTAAWGHLDPAHMSATLPRFTALIAAIVQRFSPASATLAVRQYQTERRRAGIVTPYRPKPASPPPREQVAKTVSWATQPLWKAEPDTLPQVVETAQTNLAGAVDNLVLDVGRATIIDNVAADAKAKAWARVPEPGCCAFCALLATRGAVYKEDSFKQSNAKFAGGGFSFKVHDHCRCHVEPVFNAYEPTAEIRRWQAEWKEVSAGLHGADARLAWRQHYEGREVTARPGSSQRSGGRGTAPTHDPARDVDASRSVAELQQTLDALEHSLTKFDSPGTRKRVEELRRKIAERS
jgi:hypothetical protein